MLDSMLSPCRSEFSVQDKLSYLIPHNIKFYNHASEALVSEVEEAPTGALFSTDVEAIQSNFERVYEEMIGGDVRIVYEKSSALFSDPITFSDFTFLRVLGRGGYATVILGRHINSKKVYALKVQEKKYEAKQYTASVMKEALILVQIQHPFIIQMFAFFQTRDFFCHLLEFCPGGELFRRLQTLKQLHEDAVKFYAAEIVLAISFLHENEIVFQDLKLENVLLDCDGHVRLADFNSCTFGTEPRTSGRLRGSLQYLAPEIINHEPSGTECDWWCLGILVFELLTGTVPYTAKCMDELIRTHARQKIKLPYYVTPEANSFVLRLLEKNPSKRLGGGSRGAKEVKNHPFFRGIDWNKLYNKQIPPPFVPELDSEIDPRYFIDSSISRDPRI